MSSPETRLKGVDIYTLRASDPLTRFPSKQPIVSFKPDFEPRSGLRKIKPATPVPFTFKLVRGSEGLVTEDAVSKQLHGFRVLVVEDEDFLADDIARELTSCGAIGIGPAVPLAGEPFVAAYRFLVEGTRLCFGAARPEAGPRTAASSTKSALAAAYLAAGLPFAEPSITRSPFDLSTRQRHLLPRFFKTMSNNGYD